MSQHTQTMLEFAEAESALLARLDSAYNGIRSLLADRTFLNRSAKEHTDRLNAFNGALGDVWRFKEMRSMIASAMTALTKEAGDGDGALQQTPPGPGLPGSDPR